MTDAEPLEPADRVIEARVLEMEPLANAELRRVAGKMFERRLGRSILAEESHVEVPVIGRTLGLLVARRGGPGTRKVVKAIPVDARRSSDEELRRAIHSPGLDFLGPDG